MKQNESKKVRGLYNSSITRVRPFFRALFKVDETGNLWLPELLKAMPLNNGLVQALCKNPSNILEDCLCKREYKDRILGTIDLENCFEYQIPPSKEFLKWSLENPDMLQWPDNGRKEFGADTQYKRECLFGHHGDNLKEFITEEGIDLLKSKGVSLSSRKWWAFEGFTEMDCLIETDDYLLGFEGKRTEFISPSTYWFPDRNQIVRNLEVLDELARESEKEYAFILITEDGENPLKEEHFRVSLPHNEGLVSELSKHFLGCISWEQACEATGINFSELPYDINSITWPCSSTSKAVTDSTSKKELRENDYKLLRMHGKITPRYDHYEAKLRNDLFMVGSLHIVTGKGIFERIRLVGYELPLYHNRDECIDLLGYDENHNLYVIELKINNKMPPEEISDQLSRYTESIKDLTSLLAEEIKNELFLKEFSFSEKVFKLALVPSDYHGPEGYNKTQWQDDVVVCSIRWNTNLSNLVENRGNEGYVTLDIKANREQYKSKLTC